MKSLNAEALENTLRRDRSLARGWRAVFGRAKPGSIRGVDRYIHEMRRANPKDWE